MEVIYYFSTEAGTMTGSVNVYGYLTNKSYDGKFL
jgi:hypothetical protein